LIKVLLTGSKGQLGFSIKNLLPKGVDLVSLDKNQFDLSKINNIKKNLKNIKPDFIINAGAYTNVDLAEKESDLCFAINAEAPFIFANQIKEYGGNLLQISSDYVFDGRKNSPYITKDIRNPISSYGYSKAKISY